MSCEHVCCLSCLYLLAGKVAPGGAVVVGPPPPSAGYQPYSPQGTADAEAGAVPVRAGSALISPALK